MDPESALKALPRALGVKVGMLLAATILIAGGFVLYVLFARGTFEHTQRLYLIAGDVEGVAIGMNITFSGFPVGRVRRISLGADGKAKIEIDVREDDAKWLRTSSVFTLERGLVGGAKIRVYSGNLQDPPLPDGAERPVLRGDTSEEMPQLVATARGILENVERMTSSGGAVQATFANLQKLSERMSGPNGMLGALVGSDEQVAKVIGTVERANGLLASLERTTSRLDSLLANADRRVLGDGGVVDEARKAVTQAEALIGDVRGSMKKLDALLADAQSVGASAKSATADLAQLRGEVDENMRKISRLVDEMNRKWPFQRETGITLP
ncbi:MAG TPA: MlaD family protein [Burkholderiales bacterium]|nr:MlaD family protein [Burkholderiales bacterium]